MYPWTCPLKAKGQQIPRKLKRWETQVIGHFCFQSDILLLQCHSRSSTLSKFRNQTRVIVKALARPIESKVLQEVVLVEERIDSVLKLVGAGNLPNPVKIRWDLRWDCFQNTFSFTVIWHALVRFPFLIVIRSHHEVVQTVYRNSEMGINYIFANQFQTYFHYPRFCFVVIKAISKQLATVERFLFSWD